MAESCDSYRPHDPGHDYYAPGIYLITLVVRNRRENGRMFGALNDDLQQPAVVLNDVGMGVLRCWEEIPERQAKHGRKVVVHTAICMPDHFHGVIEVVEKMDVSLGEVIRGFKAGCTMAWRAAERAKQRPSMVVESRAGIGAGGEAGIGVGGEAGNGAGGEAGIGAGGGAGIGVGGEAGIGMGGEAGNGAGGEAGIGAGMGAMTMALPQTATQPYLDEQQEREMLKRMSKKQRAAYYAAHPEALQPLWDDNYDDTICLSDPATGEYCQRHFAAMVQYVDDNARRAIIMRLRPEFMRRCLHVRIASVDTNGRPVVRDYAAFGNLFLLRWARKVQVQCHRLAERGMLTDEEWQKATANWNAIRAFETYARAHNMRHFDRDWYRSTNPKTTTAIDYSRTAAYRREHDGWVAQVMAGATVIVTPGISAGELLMKNECLERGFPLIHLQKEPIGPHWKPEKTRFDACTRGRLLILAPWRAEELGEVKGVPSATNYSIFHNLNLLAEEICLFDGEAGILSDAIL